MALQVTDSLLARCRLGEIAAQRELFDATAGDVHRIMSRLAFRRDEVDDLVQEAYLALWRSLASYRGESKFSSFVYGICLNVVRKHRRSWARFTRLRRSVQDEPSPATSTPLDHVADGDRSRAVTRALARLSFKARSVLVLFEMEGLSGQEIASQLQIPEKTVWTRLHHARNAFRRYYKLE